MSDMFRTVQVEKPASTRTDANGNVRITDAYTATQLASLVVVFVTALKDGKVTGGIRRLTMAQGGDERFYVAPFRTGTVVPKDAVGISIAVLNDNGTIQRHPVVVEPGKSHTFDGKSALAGWTLTWIEVGKNARIGFASESAAPTQTVKAAPTVITKAF